MLVRLHKGQRDIFNILKSCVFLAEGKCLCPGPHDQGVTKTTINSFLEKSEP